MRWLLHIFVLAYADCGRGEDVWQIGAQGDRTIPFEATRKINVTHWPGTGTVETCNQTVKAQYIARNLFLITETRNIYIRLA